jgi:hypothetical protein
VAGRRDGGLGEGSRWFWNLTRIVFAQDNRDACVDDFVKASPDIASFVEQLQEYGDASQRLSSMCAQVPVAWMVVDTSMLCRALSKEAVKWQQGYGRALVDWVYRQVDALRDFLDTTEDELRRPVVQLKQLSGNTCQERLNHFTVFARYCLTVCAWQSAC